LKKKFVIIDAMAVAYRSYFAFINRPLITKQGEPTSAIFGFVNQLLKIISDLKPDYIAVATDSKEKTFRHKIYEKYKSSRSDMPEDMIPQITRIYEIISAFNIPLFKNPGYEADDIIGTAVKIAEQNNLLSFAVTPDKDFVQLVSENISLVKPGKASEEPIIIDLDTVIKNYDFNPIQMIDYLALVGDASDDIPGVAGIGPKTATPLIKEYGTIENIYKNIDLIEKKGLKNKLINSKENAFLSKTLATIKLDVPINFELKELEFCKPNFDKLNKIFAELEFSHFSSKIPTLFFEKKTTTDLQISDTKKHKTFTKENVKYHLITSIIDAENLAKNLINSSEFVFDTETDSLDTLTLNLAGASFAIKENEAWFVATNSGNSTNNLFEKEITDRLPIADFIKIFKPVFENKKIKKICQNGKFDISVLSKYGINLEGFYFDTMIASYILNPNEKHGMDELSEKYLNYKPISFKEIIGDKKEAKNIFDVDLQILCEYACEDADITLRLYKFLKEEIKKNNLEQIAYNVEFPLVKVLANIERNGVVIDKVALGKFSKKLNTLIENYKKQIFKLAGCEFNLNSPKQLQVILFENLELRPTKKTKTGFSTNAQTLEMLRGQHEIIDLILNYRQVQKLKSTYADALPELIHPITGRIHTTYNQAVTSTGRLSSINPNLQNIPIRTELGKEIRRAFVATDKNHLILSADYSQIELRIMASICGEDNLIKAFKNGEDIHRATAAMVFMVNPEDVTPDMRRKAKEVNFGILYGIGPFGLKTRLGILQSHAKEIIETYFEKFPKVKDYIDESIEKARKNGYAETLLGRKRILPNINSKNRTVRQFEERVATNMPIQGTAADMIKLAMINIDKVFTKLKVKSKMILQVHDELVFELRKDESEKLIPLIVEKMETALKLDVPIKVDYNVADNWLDAH